jgi:hypothetical protein
VYLILESCYKREICIENISQTLAKVKKYIIFYAKVTSFDFLNNALRALVSIFLNFIAIYFSMFSSSYIRFHIIVFIVNISP